MTTRGRKGEFKPKNPSKYKGTHPIVWRSTWELKGMLFFDGHPAILEWTSESIVIPYWHPIKSRPARYFPDFSVKIRTRSGEIKSWVVEVKPSKEVAPPNMRPGRKKATLANEMATYLVNQAKWEAARAFCSKHGMEFKVITEADLFGR